MNKKPQKKLFRKNVAAVIVDQKGLILTGHRRGMENDTWQLPQGGIDKMETPDQAVLREIEEETGVSKITFKQRTNDWLYYEFPEGVKRKNEKHLGQRQIYFKFLINEEDKKSIKPSRELDKFEFVNVKMVLNRVVDFKKDVYQKAFEELGLM